MSVNVPITTTFDPSGVNSAQQGIGSFADKTSRTLERVAFFAKGVSLAFAGWAIIRRYTQKTRDDLGQVDTAMKKTGDESSKLSRKVADNLGKVAAVAGGAATAFGLLSSAANRLGKGPTSQVQNFASTASSGVSSLASALTGVSVGLGVGALVNFGREAVLQASGVGESLNFLNVVLGDSSKKIDEWSRTTASSIGISRVEALEAAGNFALFFKAAGQTADQAADSSTQFVKLAADLGSIKNVPVPQALEKIGAALRGEYEPIRSLGILLDEATIKQTALAKGIIATDEEALTPQQRTLAASAAILEKASFATDDFKNTQDSLANRIKTAQAKFSDFRTELGDRLEPTVLRLWDAFNTKVLPVLERLKNEFLPVIIEAFGTFRNKVVPLAKELGEKLAPAAERFLQFLIDNKTEVLIFVGVFGALAATALLVAGAVSIAAAALSPVTLAIIAVAAVVAGLVTLFVTLYRRNETFREGVQTAWRKIRSAIEFVVGKIKAAIERFRATWDLLKDAFEAFQEKDWPRFWTAIQGALKQGLEGVKELLSIGKAIFFDWIRDLGRAIGPKLVELGKDLGNYLLDELAKTVKDPTRIVRAFEAIGDALRLSFDIAVAAIATIWNSTLGGFTFTLPDWFGWVIPGLGGASITIPRMSHRWSTSPGGSSGGGAPPEMIGPGFETPSPGVVMPLSVLSSPVPAEGITINVSGAIDPVSVANQIHRLLEKRDYRTAVA